MPRINLRALILLMLILLVVVAPVLAAPTLDVTLSHVGNAGVTNIDFGTNSTDGTVTVAIRNISPTDPTTGLLTANVTLNGGLTFGAFVSSTPGSLFTCMSPIAGTVSCETSNSIPADSTETVTFSVIAPNTTTASAVTNSVTVTGGNAVDVTADDPDFFNVVSAAVDLVITGVTHVGNSGPNFVVNTNTGSVTITLQNNGTDASNGTATLIVTLAGGLTFSAGSGALFSCPSAAGSSTVTCTTDANIGPGDGDIITFTVTAPGIANCGNFTNSATLVGGGDGTTDNKSDLVTFGITLSGTTTCAGSPTPSPTFPFTPTPVPTSTPTLIPNPPTRTPVPRSPNAGRAVGPRPHANVTVVVDRDGVNVRLIPAIGAEVIANVNAGFTTDIISRSPDSEWVEVEIAGQLGWIGTAVLAIISGDLNSAPVSDPRTIPYGGFENPRAGTTSVTSQFTGKLQLSGLRVRGGPGRAYPVLANAPRYTIFSILGRSSSNLWLQVNFEGTLGWVATEFVELQQGVTTLAALPIDGIVADTVPVSEPTFDSFTDVLRLMLARVELAQPSLDSIRGTWTSIALGQGVQCANFPARPNDIQIANAVLAPFYTTLFPLNTDFNSAMQSLRQAIDLFIAVCNQRQPTSGLAGSPLTQQALDAVNAADALFASLRQRLNALLPQENLGDDACLFSFQNRAQAVPRLRVNSALVTHMTRRNFILGFCFDGAAGQSLRLQALRVNGNAEPRLTVSSFDNPTNFIGTTQITNATTDVSIQQILITQTGRYILIMADLDGAPGADLDSEIALLLTDATSGLGAATLAIDANGNVVVLPGGAVTPGAIGLTPFDLSGVVTPGVGGTPVNTPIPTVGGGGG